MEHSQKRLRIGKNPTPLLSALHSNLVQKGHQLTSSGFTLVSVRGVFLSQVISRKDLIHQAKRVCVHSDIEDEPDDISRSLASRRNL